jgi:hypothetical protein
MASKLDQRNGFALTELDPLAGIPVPPGRSCGSCVACCSTIPVSEIALPAYTRCVHLRTFPEAAHGCRIYDKRPFSCRTWSCAWLSGDMDMEMRPDRCGVVIDPIPDTIKVNGVTVPAAQFWVLRGFEDAWKDQPILDIIVHVVETGVAVLWRHAPDTAGRKMARAFMRHPQTGVYSRSALFEEREDHDLGGDAQRMREAQELLQRGR